MDAKIREMLYRVKNSAVDAGKAAGKAAGNVMEQAKLNIRIFDLNTEIDVNYKEIGKLVYSVHKGEEICSEAIQTLIEAIDDKTAQIKTIREKLDSFKASALSCPTCGKTVSAKDVYCSACGHKFTDDSCSASECSFEAACEESCETSTPSCESAGEDCTEEK